jgi:transcriptional regulator with XRE-family HTH domain
MDRGVLGERIRAVRMARGISQEALARGADVSLNLVNKLERGVITDPHYSTLSGIASALGVSVEDLVREPVPLGEPPKEESGPKVVTGSARIPLPPEQFAVLAALADREISIEEAAERLARIRASELATV